MKCKRTIQFALILAAATLVLSPKASATGSPVYSYYPIAAGGCATSISAWRFGDTWVTGCNGGYENDVYELIRSNNGPEYWAWRNFTAKQIAVVPDSNIGLPPNVWALSGGQLYQYRGSNTWTRYPYQPSCTQWVAAAMEKEVWIVECDNTIAYMSPDGAFTSRGPAPEPLTQVAVPLGGGNPWFLAASGNIYSFDGAWHLEPGCAQSIGIGGDGMPWVVGCGSDSVGNLYRWNGYDWSRIQWNQPLNFRAVSVSVDDVLWGIGDGTTNPWGAIVEQTAELDFKMANTPQAESNWCWAAGSQSVYNYVTDSANIEDQCLLVDQVLGRSDCCNGDQPCNNPGWPESVFNYEGMTYATSGDYYYDNLIANLDANSPVLVFYLPESDGVGHIEVGEGTYAYDGTEYVERWNPEPVGIGTWEDVTWPQFLNPDSSYTTYEWYTSIY